jgi:serine protease inhibitor
MVALSMRPTKPPRTFEMIVDRPFFFAIRDDLTNTILFMGSVEEPDS